MKFEKQVLSLMTAALLCGTFTTLSSAQQTANGSAAVVGTPTASVADVRASSIPRDPLAAAHLIMPAAAAPLMAQRFPAYIPARSAASITEATRGHFPLAVEQASAGASMVAEVTDENDASTTVKSIKGV